VKVNEKKMCIPIKIVIFVTSISYRALTNGAAFTQKLHLIYLVNDVIHHW
jgi:hypothetical protein